jgi:hypothetical protein
VSSAAPAYSLAAVLAVLAGAVGLHAPAAVLLAFIPNRGGQDMAQDVRSAQHKAYQARRELLTALQAALSTPLRDDPEAEGRQSDMASDGVHDVKRDYREAMAALLEGDDLRVVLAGQVLYRRYLGIADAIVAVADRLWFVVLRGA